MDISMLVSGTMELSRRPSNIDKLLDEVHNDFIESCAVKGLELHLSKSSTDESLVLRTDNEKLRKILAHLLDNAVKFTRKGGISFGCSTTENSALFFVKDTGTGIKAESLNIIFDAFMSADVSTTRGYEGSGLGLTIANEMVKLLGGKLWVESENGKGSTFFVELPFLENQVIKPQSIMEKNSTSSDIKPLILVAEDDDSNFKYTEIVLQNASYVVVRAENGREAVNACKTMPDIALVLMDIKMPILDGFEAAKQIKRFLPNLPIIALTAHVTTEDENMAYASGCSDYITKPVSKARLIEIIGKSLSSAS